MASQNVSEAFATILKHNLEHLLAWEDTARSGQDIEGVHQTRVAFRRMRSALQTFRAAVPRKITDHWSEEMRWLASELGAARDIDVFIDEALSPVLGLLAIAGEDKLTELALAYRAKSYERVRAMLAGERYLVFKKDFSAWVERRDWLHHEIPDKKRKRLDSNVGQFARRLLDRQERNVLEIGTHVDKDSSEQMHRLRIACKKLRYAAEFFIPLYSGMSEFIGHMKGLQDLLGIMNDVAVMENLLQHVMGGSTDPEVLHYAGAIVGWRTRQYHELKGTFDSRWDEFVHARHPWWHKTTNQDG